MSTDLLINLIQNQRILYDKSLKDYSNRVKKERAWQSVARDAGISVEDAKKQFASLRQKYSREKKKIENQTRSGNTGGFQYNWVYYDKLSFLKQFVLPRKTTSNDVFSFDRRVNQFDDDYDNNSGEYNPQLYYESHNDNEDYVHDVHRSIPDEIEDSTLYDSVDTSNNEYQHSVALPVTIISNQPVVSDHRVVSDQGIISEQHENLTPMPTTPNNAQRQSSSLLPNPINSRCLQPSSTITSSSARQQLSNGTKLPSGNSSSKYGQTVDVSRENVYEEQLNPNPYLPNSNRLSNHQSQSSSAGSISSVRVNLQSTNIMKPNSNQQRQQLSTSVASTTSSIGDHSSNNIDNITRDLLDEDLVNPQLPARGTKTPLPPQATVTQSVSRIQSNLQTNNHNNSSYQQRQQISLHPKSSEFPYYKNNVVTHKIQQQVTLLLWK